MSQLRAAMNHRNNLKAIENLIKNFQNNQNNFQLSDNSEILNSTQSNQDYAIDISDSEDEEIQEQERNNNAISAEEWNEIVSKWITMVDDDEHVRNEEEWDLQDSDELELDENAITSNQVDNVIDHPSINKDAKWNLGSLFSQNLLTPPYLSELEK
ncbi:15240_t:CDS:1 [Dentiscutata heterogama]|uniref:15240_t:CDS:1 n=1 Tax=Dentiscutata heterogama TaxID=1316150 RepID=A0ACA9QF45_9GLOM|nr:15240_t:CDS:1 [Dentiscutata heterogama]